MSSNAIARELVGNISKATPVAKPCPRKKICRNTNSKWIIWCMVAIVDADMIEISVKILYNMTQGVNCGRYARNVLAILERPLNQLLRFETSTWETDQILKNIHIPETALALLLYSDRLVSAGVV